jgi:hypothetical protein
MDTKRKSLLLQLKHLQPKFKLFRLALQHKLRLTLIKNQSIIKRLLFMMISMTEKMQKIRKS